MPWVIDQWAKSECEIELSGGFIQSVDLDGPDADLGRDIQRATQGIHQQQRSKKKGKRKRTGIILDVYSFRFGQ